MTCSGLLPYICNWEVFENIEWEPRQDGFRKLEYFLSRECSISTIYFAMGNKENTTILSPDQAITMMTKINEDNSPSPSPPPNLECGEGLDMEGGEEPLNRLTFTLQR